MSLPARAPSVRIVRDGPSDPASSGRAEAGAGATRSIRTSHGRIEVCTSPGTGTPLVLLHGHSRDKADFARLMASPAARGRSMVAVDLPGHGGSGTADDPEHSYTLDGYADAVVEVLEHLGIERAGVLGRSFGARVGLRVAGAFPGFAGLLVDRGDHTAPRGTADGLARSRGPWAGDGAPAPRLAWRADDRYRRIAAPDRAPTAAELAALALSFSGRGPVLGMATGSGRGIVDPAADGVPRGATERDPPSMSLRRFLAKVDRVSPHLSLGLCLSG